MQVAGVSPDPSAVGPRNRIPSFGALLAAPEPAAGPETVPPVTVVPRSPGAAKGFSLAMLLLGVALLWLVPLGGALLLATAGVCLALSWEAEPGGYPASSSTDTTLAPSTTIS